MRHQHSMQKNADADADVDADGIYRVEDHVSVVCPLIRVSVLFAFCLSKSRRKWVIHSYWKRVVGEDRLPLSKKGRNNNTP